MNTYCRNALSTCMIEYPITSKYVHIYNNVDNKQAQKKEWIRSLITSPNKYMAIHTATPDIGGV